MSAEIKNLFTGEVIENILDDDIKKLLEMMLNHRCENDTDFSKAFAIHVIFEYKDKDGLFKYGYYNSGMTNNEILWAMEKIKLTILKG